MFRRLVDDGPKVAVWIDDDCVEVPAGESVAAALLAHGVASVRATAVSGRPRGPYCMMGVCHDCLVEIDGAQNRQACRVQVAEGMRVRRQSGARQVEP